MGACLDVSEVRFVEFLFSGRSDSCWGVLGWVSR